MSAVENTHDREQPPIDAYLDNFEPVKTNGAQDEKLARKGGVPSTALQFVTLDEFVTKPIIVAAHVSRLIPPTSIVVAFGPPKSGKTFAVCDLVMHAAHGLPEWHGCKIPKALKVAFLAGEGTIGLRVRLRAWQSEHGAELKGGFILLTEAIGLPQRVGEVMASLREYMPDILVVDTLNAFFGHGDENSTQDMSAFTSTVRFIRDGLKCSVVVIHHTGLADAARERGSSVLRGAADVIVQVARDESGSGLVGFQVIQARDLEAWDKPIALRLRRVETDWTDQDGAPLSTCVVEAGNQPVTIPGRGGKPLGERQRQLFDIAQKMATQKANGAAEVMLMRADVTKEALASGMAKQTISSAWGPLADRGYWRLIEPGTVVLRTRR